MLLHTVRWLWSEDQRMLFTVVMIRLRFNAFRSESPEGGTAKLRNLCHPECALLAPPLGNRRQCKLLSSRRLISAANGSETAIEEIMGVGDRFRAQTNRTGLRGLLKKQASEVHGFTESAISIVEISVDS